MHGRKRILIVAATFGRARDIAEDYGLRVREWKFVNGPEMVLGFRHREPEELFDPEYDVLVEPCIGNKVSYWEELKINMDSAGLVYVKARGDC